MKKFSFTLVSNNSFFILVFLLTLQKSLLNSTKKIKMSILKSPHVNKKAQEQFELKKFKSKYNYYFLQSFKNMVFLKKLYSKILSSVSLNIRHISTNYKHKNWGLYIFNLNNLWKCIYYVFRKNLYKYVNNLFANLSVYGELFILCSNSSIR